jgi:surface antigen
MLGRKVILRFLVLGLLAPGLAGCGVVPMVAQQTTAAALAPFTAASQAAATNMQILGRGVQYMTAQTSQTTRQIAAVNNTASRYRPQPAAYQAAPRANRNQSTNKKKAETSTAEQKAPAFDVLPQDILARLTEDQAGLQKAAQSAAISAPVGETIFWHLEGREGTATTETENLMGSFTCRTFVQTIALEDYFDKASLTACRNPSGAWITSF